jgi:hypothetical protein
VIPYDIIRPDTECEEATLNMLCRKYEGGAGKNFSRQDAPLHCLTAAVTSGIPPLLS